MLFAVSVSVSHSCLVPLKTTPLKSLYDMMRIIISFLCVFSFLWLCRCQGDVLWTTNIGLAHKPRGISSAVFTLREGDVIAEEVKLFCVQYEINNRDCKYLHDVVPTTLSDLPDSPVRKLITQRIHGRLGNQMFKVASTIGIVNALNQDKEVNNHFSVQFCFLLHDELKGIDPLSSIFFFNLTEHMCASPAQIAIVQERGYAMHDSTILSRSKLHHYIEIDGYLQSFKYFDHCRDMIRALFQFQPHIQAEAAAWVAANIPQYTDGSSSSKQISGGNGGRRLVCAHGRFGDHEFQNQYLQRPGAAWYRSLFAQLNSSTTSFVLFSDDPDKFQYSLGFNQGQAFNMYRSSYNTPAVDMAILSTHCDDIILSRGTFGWWASYLSDKAKIWYSPEFVMEHDVNADMVVLDEYYPPSWNRFEATPSVEIIVSMDIQLNSAGPATQFLLFADQDVFQTVLDFCTAYKLVPESCGLLRAEIIQYLFVSESAVASKCACSEASHPEGCVCGLDESKEVQSRADQLLLSKEQQQRQEQQQREASEKVKSSAEISTKQSQSAIVTAYFDIPSKASAETYEVWMRNIFCLEDPIIVFTSPDMVSTIQEMRSHVLDKTHIITMALTDLPVAKKFDNLFWEMQLNRDPERDIHQSFQLFWIWLSKSWFVNEAIRVNPFASDVFMWSDIGCFRNEKYNGHILLKHVEMIPADAMLMAAWIRPEISDTPWIEKNLRKKALTFLAGAQFVGHIKTWQRFHAAFEVTIREYANRDLFLGEDQALLLSTCMQHTEMCSFVTPDMVGADHNTWFALQEILHSRGNVFYRDAALLFWLPPKKRGLLCTLVKDEPPDVVNAWVEHHVGLGFDIVLYDHMSTVPLLPRAHVRVTRFPYSYNIHDKNNTCNTGDHSVRCATLRKCQEWESGPKTVSHGFAVCQEAAYMDCLSEHGSSYNWVGTLDVDEYVFATESSGFWNVVDKVGASGQSLELVCLKFGPKGHHYDGITTFPGDPAAHLWRAPYPHLGDAVPCVAEVCENYGSTKFLSRMSAVERMHVHHHEYRGNDTYGVIPFSQHGVRCHHYAYRSQEHIRVKMEKNRNPFLQTQLSAGVFADEGWFNLVKDSNYSLSRPNVREVCISFLSCKRLDKLMRTYAAILDLVRAAPSLHFSLAILDNGSGELVHDWIRRQTFDHITLLEENVGIARGLDMLWASCGDAPYILTVEDDWVYNANTLAPAQALLEEAIAILETHEDVLEVSLRREDIFHTLPGERISASGHVERELPILEGHPLAYYLTASTKRHFPWWGQYTNGASLKHAGRLARIGPMFQHSCGDTGNCESEFTAKTAVLRMKGARFCWRGDLCDVSGNNEPLGLVMFQHQDGERSPGHDMRIDETI